MANNLAALCALVPKVFKFSQKKGIVALFLVPKRPGVSKLIVILLMIFIWIFLANWL